MNIFEAVFCRTFQFGFRIALPVLPYREPKILESMVQVPELLKQKGVKKILLVTDAFLSRSDAIQPLLTLLEAGSIGCAVYDGTRANPTVENVEAAFDLYRREGCAALIAFGGGSPMDCAKAVGARAAYPNKPLSRMKGLLRVLRRIPTLIAIPTTAGTGSETTLAAVITDDQKKHKYAMYDFTLIPHYAVLDPKVTYTLPRHLTSTTGMDALTHAVEAFIGGTTTKETRSLALEATRLIFANIETAYHEPENETARRNMLLAAYKAGIAFSKSYVGYVHTVAHSLGGQYNIPHGLANSVLLPYVLEEYGAAAEKKLHKLAVAAGVATEAESDAQAASKFICAVRELNRRMEIPDKLDGILDEDIPHMAKKSAKEGNPLYPVPKLMNAKELEKFYHMVKK